MQVPDSGYDGAGGAEGAAGHHLRPAMTELSSAGGHASLLEPPNSYWISLMMLNIGR
jgi:hypothetical protein